MDFEDFLRSERIREEDFENMDRKKQQRLMDKYKRKTGQVKKRADSYDFFDEMPPKK